MGYSLHCINELLAPSVTFKFLVNEFIIGIIIIFNALVGAVGDLNFFSQLGYY